MNASDDDEDLKRAIAMSLGQEQPVSAAVNESADSDDEDLRKALALSLQDSERHKGSKAVPHKYIFPTPPASQPSAQQQASASYLTPISTTNGNPSTSLLGLDRKAMEQERLARLGKRKRSVSPEKPSTSVMQTAPSSDVASSEGKRTKRMNAPPIQYPHGIIKRTWAYKHPRTNDIKIEEVFQAATANIALFSAMAWDDAWIFSKLPPGKTKQIWALNVKGQDLQEHFLREATEANNPNVKPHFPPMDGNISQMHSKLMLLFHETHLRVVVPTANMIKFDWGETNKDPKTGESWQAAVLENSLFLIDLPRRLNGEIGSKKDLTPFGGELVAFLEAQDFRKNLIEGVLKFDFSQTGHLAFIHSIPGQYTEEYDGRTGLPGLANAVRKLGLDQVEHLELDYAASSLGAVKSSFLEQLYRAAGGQSFPTTYKVPGNFLDRIRIYFPSRDTVKSSTGGPNCAGIITLNRKDYRDAFPKQCMRKHESTRPGLLSHNKILLARGRKKDGSAFAWAYVGSANLSESAWGSQKILKSGKEGKLNIRNWECGVVVPVPDEAFQNLDLKDEEIPPMSVFNGTIEVPFQYPGERFGSNEPWFFRDEH